MSALAIVEALLPGLWVTIWLTAWAIALALPAALLAGLGRLSVHAGPRLLARAYVEFFRGTSALVQLFWAYFVLPFFGIPLSAELAGILVLGLNTGAYGAEVVRAAILAVPAGQRDAATALNLSRRQTLWRIILPQALRLALPPAGNLAIELLKNTALVSLVTIADLTFRAQILRADTLQTGLIFSLVLLLYFAVAQLLRLLLRQAERRLARAYAPAGRS